MNYCERCKMLIFNRLKSAKYCKRCSDIVRAQQSKKYLEKRKHLNN